MGNWQTREKKRNKKHKDKNYRKFYTQPTPNQSIDKNDIRDKRKQMELEQEYDLE